MNTNGSVVLTRKVIITSPSPIKKEDFIKKIGEIARNITVYLKKNGCSQLGHLKLISTTDGEDYLQLSILDMTQKPQIKGILRETFEKIKLTFNIIEFGVRKEDIDSKVNEEIKSMKSYFDNR
jgi:hypothetical protein